MPWSPELSIEEKLKYLLVPPSLYMRYRLRKELRRGEPEIHLIPFLADTDKLALDIGANKGVWSYALSRLGCNVVAFEPNPKMFRVLDRCAPDSVTRHNMALSDQSGIAHLRIPVTSKGHSNQGASLSAVKVADNFDSVEVEARTLDDMDLTNVGFMKIDVEGFELEVLTGAARTIARDRPNLVVELEERHTDKKLDELVGTVCTYGYRAYVLSNNVLTPFGRAHVGNHVDSHGRYLFNFIFLPDD